MFHTFFSLTHPKVVVFLLQKSHHSLQQTQTACDEDIQDTEGINEKKKAAINLLSNNY